MPDLKAALRVRLLKAARVLFGIEEEVKPGEAFRWGGAEDDLVSEYRAGGFQDGGILPTDEAWPQSERRVSENYLIVTRCENCGERSKVIVSMAEVLAIAADSIPEVTPASNTVWFPSQVYAARAECECAACGVRLDVSLAAPRARRIVLDALNDGDLGLAEAAQALAKMFLLSRVGLRGKIVREAH